MTIFLPMPVIVNKNATVKNTRNNLLFTETKYVREKLLYFDKLTVWLNFPPKLAAAFTCGGENLSSAKRKHAFPRRVLNIKSVNVHEKFSSQAIVPVLMFGHLWVLLYGRM